MMSISAPRKHIWLIWQGVRRYTLNIEGRVTSNRSTPLWSTEPFMLSGFKAKGSVILTLLWSFRNFLKLVPIAQEETRGEEKRGDGQQKKKRRGGNLSFKGCESKCNWSWGPEATSVWQSCQTQRYAMWILIMDHCRGQMFIISQVITAIFFICNPNGHLTVSWPSGSSDLIAKQIWMVKHCT